MKIAPRERLIIVAVGVFLLVVVVAVIGIYPQLTEYKALNAQIEAANQQASQNQAVLEARQAAKQRAAQTDAESLRLMNMVPENAELPSLIIELQDMALSSGVDLNSVQPAAPVSGASSALSGVAPRAGAPATFVTLPLSVSITGTWSDTIDYMRRVIHASRAMRIVSFSTSPNGIVEATGTPTVSNDTTTLQLEAYAIPAASAAPSQPATTPPTGQ